MDKPYTKEISSSGEEMYVFKDSVEQQSLEKGHSFGALQESIQHEIVKKAVNKHKEQAPKLFTKEYKAKKTTNKKIVLNLSPDEDDKRVNTLLSLVKEVGLYKTLKAIEKTESFHVQDDFHRFLVQYLKSGDKIPVNEKTPEGKSLGMVVFEVAFQEIVKNKDEKEPDLADLIAPMEQFYSGMLSVGEKSKIKHIAIEVAYPPGKDKVSFYCAVPIEYQEIFKNHLLAVFPHGSVVEVFDDYNIFSRENNAVISRGKFSNNQFLPIKDYRVFKYDTLNTMLKSFANLKEDEGAAIQLVLSPEPEKTNADIIGSIDKLNNGKKVEEVLGEQPHWFLRFVDFIFNHTTNIIISFFDTLFGTKPGKEDEKKEEEQEYKAGIIQQLKAKNSSRLFRSNLRIVASGKDSFRSGAIVADLESIFLQYENPVGNNIMFEKLKAKEKQEEIKKYIFRLFDKDHSLLFNTAELSAFLHFPVTALKIGDVLSKSYSSSAVPQNISNDGELTLPPTVVHPQMQPEPPKEIETQDFQKKYNTDLVQQGIVNNSLVSKNIKNTSFGGSAVLLGINIHQGKETKVFLKPEDRLRHMYVVGQTGTGKTTILKNMIIQDIRNGEGVCFIDPHGSDVEDIISQIPEERFGDVIYFNPTDIQNPVGLNILEYDERFPEQKSFVIDELLGIFKKLYSDVPESMGPAFEQYFRNATALVMEHPESGNTMVEISRVLSDEVFRDLKLANCNQMLVKQFWEQIATKAEGESSLANIVPYITNKFDVFLSNDYIRPIIGQEKSAFDFREVMDNKKILLVNLSKGRIGGKNANLLGMIIVGKILMAALSRVDLLDKNLPPFYLYMDEFQNVTTDSIGQILSEARKFNLALIIAHQYLTQIDEKIQKAVFGNVGSMAIFRVGMEDAEILEKELKPIFNAHDISNIQNYNAYLKILVDGEPQKPFNIKTLPPEKSNPRIGQYLKQLSSQKYGRPRQEVEDEIRMKFEAFQDLF